MENRPFSRADMAEIGGKTHGQIWPDWGLLGITRNTFVQVVIHIGLLVLT